jgi:SAM-dependent methyltransferase
VNPVADQSSMTCRACGQVLRTVFADLGMAPISNALVDRHAAKAPEAFYPLAAYACDACYLVQLGTAIPAGAHFHDGYVYFSSVSDSWLAHARRFAETTIERFGIGSDSRVVEVASNDGYLLRYFAERGIPVLGIDPAANCAQAAWEAHGIRTEVAFFGADLGARLAAGGAGADLLIGNNVLAHVPYPVDFVRGLKALLNPGGVVSIEFPHLLELIRNRQFDTIYHEHYSYLSLLAVEPLFARFGLRIFDVERLQTHGGSLRVLLCHNDDGRLRSAAPGAILAEERAAGLDHSETYAAFNRQIVALKCDLLSLLIGLKRKGRTIAAYGAPAKGNTLLNYCGIGTEFIDFTVDRNIHKQGKLLPGSRIPILATQAIDAAKPDFVLILPWNISAEIRQQMAGIAAWGGRFIVPIPNPVILD